MFGGSSEIFGSVRFDSLRKVNSLISLAETDCPIFFPNWTVSAFLLRVLIENCLN